MGATTVFLVRTGEEVSAIEASGPAHPELGRLFDSGTYARLRGFGAVAVDQELADVLAGEPDGGFRLERLTWGPGPVPRQARAVLEEAADSGTVFVVLCGTSDGAALVVAVGRALPSMGRVDPVDVGTLRRSLRFAAGVGELDGSLFAEPPFDGEAEETRLRERLRQLYGEE